MKCRRCVWSGEEVKCRREPVEDPQMHPKGTVALLCPKCPGVVENENGWQILWIPTVPNEGAA